MSLRFPRGTTHACRLPEMYYRRVGRQLYEFNLYRNEWLLSRLLPCDLGRYHGLTQRVKGDKLL